MRISRWEQVKQAPIAFKRWVYWNGRKICLQITKSVLKTADKIATFFQTCWLIVKAFFEPRKPHVWKVNRPTFYERLTRRSIQAGKAEPQAEVGKTG